MLINKSKKKAQAMVEYILIVFFTALAFMSSSDLLIDAMSGFFEFIVSFWGKNSP
jgi:Flp pilus assembly pilin Flp